MNVKVQHPLIFTINNFFNKNFMASIGLGNPSATFVAHIENVPPLPQYQSLSSCLPLVPNDISMIASLTGNHWRKIFNVYAKLIFELSPNKHSTWQDLREYELLQKQSSQSLLFSPPSLTQLSNKATITLVLGKTYATRLEISDKCHWVSSSFAINEEKRLIICPYFDYRQLSNKKITQLCQLIKHLKGEC